MDFKQHFEIINDKFIEVAAKSKFRASDLALARYLGHDHDGKIRAWRKGQWPSAADLAVIEKKLGFNLRWLVTGEGEPFRDAHNSAATEDAAETASIHKELIALQREKITALEKEIKKLKTQLEQKPDNTTDQAGHSPLRQDPEKNTERKRTS